jgi:hypothetical protein
MRDANARHHQGILHNAPQRRRSDGAGKAEQPTSTRWIRPKKQQRLTTTPPAARLLVASRKSGSSASSFNRNRPRTQQQTQQVTLANFGFGAPAAAPRTPAAMREKAAEGSQMMESPVVSSAALAQATPIMALDLDYAGKWSVRPCAPGANRTAACVWPTAYWACHSFQNPSNIICNGLIVCFLCV